MMEDAKRIILNDTVSEINALTHLGRILEIDGFDVMFCVDADLQKVEEIGYKCTHFVETNLGKLCLCERTVDR